VKAMVLHEIADVDESPLKLQDVPDPQPGPGEVRVRVAVCAACHTDLHVAEGELPRRKLPIILGHQAVGRVDAVGRDASRFKVGDRIGIAWLRHTCGRCRFCKAGRENLCPHSRYTGYHADGGYAELAVIDEAYAYPIPDAFDDVQAAPLLCAGIVGYRALKRSNLPAGGRLAIYGFGSSAHVIAQIALHRGCELYVVTRGAGHQRLARELGAAWAGERPDQMPVKADSAIVFAPAGELVPPALEKLEKGGTLALAGIYMTPVPKMDYEKHLFGERDVHSVQANTRQDGREFLAAAAEASVRARTQTYPLADANRALADIKHDRVGGTAVLVVGE